MRRVATLLALLTCVPLLGADAATLELGEPVVMRAAAVAEVDGRFVGSTAAITITAARGGSGHIFLDTFPLTEIDMQGSARLAARVASQIAGARLAEHDFFFVLRSGSQIIGGPSAGAAMTVGAVAALQGWEVRPDVLMTGTIQPDGSVGPVGGIPEKAEAAAKAGIRRFLFPAGEETVALAADPLRPFNLTRYCADHLGIECVPVTDVRDAVGLMTDHEIARPPLTGNVTGASYRALLSDVSGDLVRNAERMEQEARAALDRMADPDARAALEARLGLAQRTLDGARAAAANGTYYTAASLSFQSAVESHHVRDAARVLAARDRAAEVGRLLEATRAEVARTRGLVEAFPGLTATRFEAAGAAQVRLLEAEDHLAEATRRLDAGEGFEAIGSIARAHQRAGTAAFWLRVAEALPAGDPLPEQGVREMARDTLTTSGEEVAYVRAVLQTRKISADLARPEALLQEAEAAYAEGFFSASMFSALEAGVRASVVLESVGYAAGVPPGKIEQKREAAALAIQAARERGVEPLLAQSQYEFGLSLDPSTPELAMEKLAFLGLGRVSANLAGLPGLFDEPRAAQSRFVGLPPALDVPATHVAAAFAVGLALGAGCGLAALMPKDEEEEAPQTRADEGPPPEGWKV